MLATRHRMCVKPKAHAKLAAAVLLVCRVPMYLYEENVFSSSKQMLSSPVWTALL